MKKSLIIAKRDLRSFFAGPMLYLISAVFIGLVGYLFFNVFDLANQMRNLPINAAVMRPLFGNINTLFIFIIPLISMTLMTEEKKRESLDMLFVAPLKDSEILLGKFLAGLGLLLFLLSLTLIFPVILIFNGLSNYASLITGYIGLVLTGSCYLVFTLFISGLTKNTIISSLFGILGLIFLASLSWTAETTSNYLVSLIFRYLSLSSHYEPFSRGVMVSSDVMYYASFFCLFWLLNLKSFDSRNW